MELKAKLYLRLLIVYLLILAGYFINFLSGGSLLVLLLQVVISSAIILCVGVYTIRKQLKKGPKKKWKLPKRVAYAYVLIAIMIFAGVSLGTLQPVLSTALILIALLITLALMKYLPNGKRRLLLVGKAFMILYVLSLLFIFTLGGSIDATFVVINALGIVSLYGLIRPKRATLIISGIYFAIIEIIVLAIIDVIPLGDSAVFFYGWSVFNILAIVYSAVLFKGLAKVKAKRR
jgi:hypothetical protein